MVFVRRYVIMLTLLLLLRTTWIIENTGILDLMDHQPLWIGGTWFETFNLGRDYILLLFCLVLVFLGSLFVKWLTGYGGQVRSLHEGIRCEMRSVIAELIIVWFYDLQERYFCISSEYEGRWPGHQSNCCWYCDILWKWLESNFDLQAMDRAHRLGQTKDVSHPNSQSLFPQKTYRLLLVNDSIWSHVIFIYWFS